MLPNVLPAWTRPETTALAFLGNATPQGAPALRLRATLRHVSFANVLSHSGGQKQRPGRQEEGSRCVNRHLALEVAQLRAALASQPGTPMVEISSSFASPAAASTATPAPAAAPAPSASDSGSHECPDELEAELSHEERTRLRELQQTCPGYFAPRGHTAGGLDRLHRRKLDKVLKKK